MYQSRGDFDATRITGALWERQPCDTPKSWAAFQLYRDAGPERSMSNTAEKVGVKPKLLARWSSRYAWVTRTDAYDNHLAVIRQDMLQKALAVKFAAEAEATASTICKAKTIVMHDLDVLVRRAEDPEMSDELLLNHKTMVQLLDRVVMLERIITGQSTSKSESRSTVDRTDRIIKQVIVDQSPAQRRTRTIDADIDDSSIDEGTEDEDGGTGNGGVVTRTGTPPLSGPMRTVRRAPTTEHR